MSLVVDIRKELNSFPLEVSFTAESETLGFLGASGCGKSMTLRCIAGVETPDEGRIVVNGVTYFDSAAKINVSPQKRKTALLFQNFQLFPNLTVEQNIAAGIDRNLNAADRRAAIGRQVERFQLQGFEKRYPAFLSGGQQQRVALARMLAAEPGILMLDEPFSALDSHLKSQLEQDLLALFSTFEGSMLYVSHDIDEAFRFCDRIAVIDRGRICEQGPTQNLVKHPTTLAGLKLSGCKNSSRARRIDDHTVEALDWAGIRLHIEDDVPVDTTHVGIRAFFIHPAEKGSANVYRWKVAQISDSRFERTVMLRLAEGGENLPVQWRVDKLKEGWDGLPEVGDEFDLSFDPGNIYAVHS